MLLSENYTWLSIFSSARAHLTAYLLSKTTLEILTWIAISPLVILTFPYFKCLQHDCLHLTFYLYLSYFCFSLPTRTETPFGLGFLLFSALQFPWHPEHNLAYSRHSIYVFKKNECMFKWAPVTKNRCLPFKSWEMMKAIVWSTLNWMEYL